MAAAELTPTSRGLKRDIIERRDAFLAEPIRTGQDGLLHVPARMFLEAAVFLGYGDEPLGKPRRKPLAEVVHLNDWEVPYPR